MTDPITKHFCDIAALIGHAQDARGATKGTDLEAWGERLQQRADDLHTKLGLGQ